MEINESDYRHIIIVCGGRFFKDKKYMRETLSRHLSRYRKEDVLIVTGDHWEGADKFAKELAIEWGYAYKGFPADWKNLGKPAGPIRNSEMADIGTECVSYWDGAVKNSGTFDMMTKAHDRLHPITIYPYKD